MAMLIIFFTILPFEKSFLASMAALQFGIYRGFACSVRPLLPNHYSTYFLSKWKAGGDTVTTGL
jgi:hypothetical protein